MYIGPWQEYKLSKAAGAAAAVGAARQNVHHSYENPNNAPQLSQRTNGESGFNRAEVEKALISTLDPEAAQQALAALFPLMQKVDNNKLNANNDHPGIAVTINSSRRPSNDNNNTLSRNPRLSRITSNSSSAAKDGDSPSSFRTSVSEPKRLGASQFAPKEPLTGRRDMNNTNQASISLRASIPKRQGLPELNLGSRHSLMDDSQFNSPFTNQPSPQYGNSANVQSGNNSRYPKPKRAGMSYDAPNVDYNANEVLAILKMDNANQKKAKFAQFWNWNDEEGIAAMKPKEKVSEADKRIQQVQLMKAAYSMKSDAAGPNPALVAANNKLLSNGQSFNELSMSGQLRVKNVDMLIPTSPIRQRHEYGEAPRTPKVEDKDLTEVDMAMISKYFKSSPMHYGQSPSPKHQGHQSRHGSDRNIHLPPISAQSNVHNDEKVAGGALWHDRLQYSPVSPTNNTKLSAISPVRTQPLGVSDASVHINELSTTRLVPAKENLDPIQGGKTPHVYKGAAGITRAHSSFSGVGGSPRDKLGKFGTPPVQPLPYHASDYTSSVASEFSAEEVTSTSGFEHLLNWSKNLNIDDF
jgi:hypothetical protein